MNHPPHWPIAGGLGCDVMGFCEIVTERENAGTGRTGQSRGSGRGSGLGEKWLVEPELGAALAPRARGVA